MEVRHVVPHSSLPVEPFAPLFRPLDEALLQHGARRAIADEKPAFHAASLWPMRSRVNRCCC